MRRRVSQPLCGGEKSRPELELELVVVWRPKVIGSSASSSESSGTTSISIGRPVWIKAL
eukprot:CAMPEP_0184369654 /NCGR_PEP_ID=MMETSP1089-20130417/162366_1 /TAXON_ID=38269 ORGANISM="Gloeochaete wittrockiana, Strain SAG46.84" /NCGR_SAMPLE_ID=MMETSP1089 /ASSEMBLY_ACC=CAM_ASM_000445 /LENGTH=58 /DNA_ID=CAMNT_0026712129 /DNA_START=19 /DNA_END=195 /DNA_ORIENTATION=+